MNKQFRTFDKMPIEDLKLYIESWLNQNPEGKIVVGTDSQKFKRKMCYATIIAMYYPSLVTKNIKSDIVVEYRSGAHLIYTRERIKTKKDYLFDRLWKEVEDTREVAEFVANEIKNLKHTVECHLDINPKVEYESNKVFQAAVGYLKSYNFIVVVKPDSWIASCAADIFSRN